MRIKASEFLYPLAHHFELKYGPKNEDFYIPVPVFKRFCFVTEKFHQLIFVTSKVNLNSNLIIYNRDCYR